MSMIDINKELYIPVLKALGVTPDEDGVLHRIHRDTDKICEINKRGMTIIMVSHDVTGSLPYATHVLHLADHKQMYYGSVSEYTSSELGKRFYKMNGDVTK